MNFRRFSHSIAVELVEHNGANNRLRDRVRVAVSSRTPVLQVAAPVRIALTRNSDRRAAIRDTWRELLVRGRLVLTYFVNIQLIYIRANLVIVWDYQEMKYDYYTCCM